MPQQFAVNDRVRHAARPEWGVGVVLDAQRAQQDGSVCQRLRVRFDGAGVKTITTAFADLRPADSYIPPVSHTSPAARGAAAAGNGSGGGGWLASLEKGSLDERLHKLPEETTDPFRSLEDRLRSTLALYKHQPAGGSLIDWASIQTGLQDPLAERNRQELETAFERFAHNREQHLKKLLLDAAKNDPQSGRRALANALPAARAAAERLLMKR